MPLVTWRAIAIGVVSFAAVVHLLHLSVNSQLPLMVLISFAFWLFLNPLIKILAPRAALSRGELLTIFTTGWVAGTMPANGWMWDVVKVAAVPTHAASPENQWAELLFDILPWHIFADTSSRVINGFWFGLDQGEAIPWWGWIGPTGQWFGVSMGMLVFGYCIFVLFHHQWVEVEKLTYPLAQMPLDLTAGCDGSQRIPKLFRSWLFWFGVVLVFLPAAYNTAGYFVDGLPKTKIFFEHIEVNLGEHFRRGLWIRLLPLVLAVAYLCPLDILASLILFYWLTLPKEFLMSRTGFTLGSGDTLMGAEEILFMEAHGATIFVALWSIWVARSHLRAIFNRVLRGGGEPGETRRYRWAVVGMVASASYVIGWIMSTGASLWLAAALLLLFTLVHFVTVKLMAATGFAYLIPNNAYLKGNMFIEHLVGTEILSARSIVAFKTFTSNAFFGSEGRIPGWPAIIHHFRIFSLQRHPMKVTAAILIAFTVGFLSIMATSIHSSYGGMQYGLGGNDHMFDGMVRLINNPTTPELGKWAVWGIGFLEAAAVAWMRVRFHWFMLHPVGLAFQQSMGGRMYWFSLVVVWMVKFTLLRYGGVRAYLAWKPLFYGMTVGYVLGVIVARSADRIWFPAASHSLHGW
jgi:hypothetical protein